MVKTFSLQFRVSKQEKETIENNSRANGYTHTSDYMRTRSLCYSVFEEKLNKIYKKLHPEEFNKIKLNGDNRNLFEYI